MILLIDIGNSRIKWASLQRGKRAASHSASRPLENQWMAFAAEAWGKLRAPKKILVCNVAGATAAEALREWALQHWKIEPRFLTAQETACGVRNAYTVAERLGADRWAGLIAARARWQEPLCIVDAGTAITLDVLDADGVHLGGLILPGIEMMRRSLLERSEGIRLAADAPAGDGISLLARDTRDGVDGGTLYAAVAAIDRIVADTGAALGVTLTGVISGGDATSLLPLLAGPYHHVPELVLDGLAVIAKEKK
ncbi:MAG: type III pantothenate kinase [Pseudomonadota bacterium]